MGQIVRVQIESRLERKVKTRAFKGIFLVRRWINDTFKSNSVQYQMHHQKNLSLGWAACSFCQRVLLAVFVSIVMSKRAR